jgi:hypothetical protein
MDKQSQKAASSPPPPPPPEVVDYMLKDLPTLKKEIFPLWRELSSLKVTIWESIFRRKLGALEAKYNDCMNKWIDAIEKVTVLEKLISPDDPKGKEKIGLLLVGGYLDDITRHENVLSRIMRDFSETLKDKKGEADYKRTLFISTIAVIIAVVSIIVSVFV